MAGEGRIKGWLQPQRAVGLSSLLALPPAVASALCGWGDAALLPWQQLLCSSCLSCGAVDVRSRVVGGVTDSCHWHREKFCICFQHSTENFRGRPEKQTSQFCENPQASLGKTALISVCCPGPC